MNKIETEDIKELFAEWGLWSLIDDVSPDGDGHGDNLQLTKEGLEAERMINLLLSDQSQKQPEGETIRNYNPEKRWDKYKKSKIEVREFDLVPKVQPEKQEEWREGLDNIDLMLAMLQSIENCTDEEVRNTAKAIREELDKVSQLLSESKEKAKIEVLEKVLEKKTNYEIEREEHGYRVTLEYVLADDIKKEIKLLKERK